MGVRGWFSEAVLAQPPLLGRQDVVVGGAGAGVPCGRPEHGNHSGTLAKCTFSCDVPHAKPRDSLLCPRGLRGSRVLPPVCGFSDPIRPFPSVHSTCSAGTPCGHGPGSLPACFHGTALPPTHCRRAPPATLGAAPAAPPDPAIPSWWPPGAASFLQDSAGGRRGWPWPQWDWDLQCHCAGQVRTGVLSDPPDTDHRPHSGPPQLECSRGPLWGCCVSRTHLRDSLCGGDQHACLGPWGLPGQQGRLGPKLSTSGSAPSRAADHRRAPSQRQATASRSFQEPDLGLARGLL